MSPLRPPSFVLNPSWPHYLGILALCLATVLGLLRSTLFDWLDPMHCHALLNTGTWLDGNWKNWQPEGCMLHTYNPGDSAKCLRSRDVVFVGDSITRKLFFQFANILDPELPLAPPNDNQKHSDHKLHSSEGTEISFLWDPFLNGTRTTDLLTNNPQDATVESKRPALLILGSGLWYLRYANASGGVTAWQANTAQRVSTITRQSIWPADLTVMLPVERVVPSKLTPDRVLTMHPSDIDAMNSDLYHRVYPGANGIDTAWIGGGKPVVSPIALPRVFNEMLDPSQTEDGLHFSDQVIKAQANVLLNLRCNDALPKVYPYSQTCCNRYPVPSPVHALVLLLVLLWGPYSWFRVRKSGTSFGIREITSSFLGENEIPALVLSAGAFFIYVADRTGLWLKEQKQFDFWGFTFLSVTCLAYGIFTLKRGDKDLGFMNRDQTDEWKGWMQLAILVYHYFGASKISGIYNPIRVLVASYLFMTGYGHTTFYLRKADFSFVRVAQIMVRLNLLTVLLAYTMNTDYMFYYFAPLVSMWYIIIYATLFLGSQYNERMVFLLGKIFLSASFTTLFFKAQWPLEILFALLKDIFNIQWSAREWTFRVTLDLWIVYVGMLAAIAVIKIREHRLTDHPKWHVAVKAAAVMSALVLAWFFAFELMQESKFTYNIWHPYISPLPVLGFVVLRNANATLRSTNSKVFMFVGKCSLELFIMQYHFWLAGDTKGVLLVIPGTQWRPINFVLTGFIFVYLCHRVANATGEVTKIMCQEPQSLPIVQVNGVSMTQASSQGGSAANGRGGGEAESIPLMPSDVESARKDMEGNPLPREPDTPIRPALGRRWVDRLADGPSPTNPRPTTRLSSMVSKVDWTWRLKGRTMIFLCCLWILNVLWTYPE
ncbi:O-acetyltransferase [Macrolepiota fuliginosa MF-IS2]|uniref:O-acetyltransferase n=1 Tax=Macrolepiota fuliginosa MF-IS2 TaxID=1400762 RepID=A0A9P5XQX6_9AGAR|nr:O-acetyltransferase [Macrolepiota fuliginosa MF-IS2]